MMKWKVIVVTHGPIINEYYKGIIVGGILENIIFFNVSDERIIRDDLEIVNKVDLPEYISLGKHYAEAEVIYNVYKLNLFDDLDALGFVHWDYEFRSENDYFGLNIVKAIDNLLLKGQEFISFSTFSFEQDYNQNIMMDPSFPNQLVGSGGNCYEKIVKDYNEFFDASINLNLMMSKQINLCSAFLCLREVFSDLMPFYSWVIEKGELKLFDTEHKYRFQGGMMERYVGVFSHRYNMAQLPLFHHYVSTQEKINQKRGFVQCFKSILRSIIRIKRN